MLCKCIDNNLYENQLTIDKVYDIIEVIFKNKPLAIFIDDNGKESSAHTYRFEKIDIGRDLV